MRAAMYKGRKRFFNRLVSWWTRGPYSHMELVLDDGISVSASAMDGGVRYKRIHYNAANWDFIELGPEPSDIRERADKKIGRGYDHRGLAGFAVRAVGDDSDKEFCSETVMDLLGYIEPWRYGPNTAAAILRSNNYGR